jgi:hypothetical protein
MPKNILKNLDGLTPDESAKLLELERSVAYKKIVRQQGNGKRNKGENTLQLVLVVQSLEGVLTY